MSLLNLLLANSAWARDLSSSERERACAAIIDRRIPVGGYVCRSGEKVEYWYGVIEGLVKIGTESEGGRSTMVTAISSGGWFGEGSMLKSEPRRYDAIALRPTRVACMPHETFRWLYNNSLAFNHYLIGQLNERCGQFLAMLEYDRLLDRDGRVAHCLSVLFNPHLYPGASPHIEISQEEIGNLAGISRPHVNKALHSLEHAGLIQIDFRGITIKDLAGLRNYGSPAKSAPSMSLTQPTEVTTTGPKPDTM